MYKIKSFAFVSFFAVLKIWHSIYLNDEIYSDTQYEKSLSQMQVTNNISFTPWDIEAASLNTPKHTRKPYTIIIYLNGSDLESNHGAATADILQIMESGLGSENANIVIFSGGTNRWQNNVIPANNCLIWEISDGILKKIDSVGLVNMGDAGTLSSFITYAINNFPAEKFGLIMWDHGGGSIAGYGHDENFNNNNLTLPEMEYAFKKAGLNKNKFEFLGFDSCLMASVEMAVIACEYFNYLIASEDLEPGEGWNYKFLEVLNTNPRANGEQIGIAVTDYFMDYYRAASDEILTMSVTDLSKVNEVMIAMGKLMKLCNNSLYNNTPTAFTALAQKRNITKTFGNGSPRDNESDMVDIGDMAIKLYDLYPKEANLVLDALDNSVVYNRHNSNESLRGLSTFYIYAGRDCGILSLSSYTALNMNNSYTKYLNYFYEILVNKDTVLSDKWINTQLTLWESSSDNTYARMIGLQNSSYNQDYDKLWPQINGMNICLFKINSSNESLQYAVPALVNGRDCDIIISICDNFPTGKILGIRYEDGFIMQKGFDEININDKIAFYYQFKNFSNSALSNDIQWYKGDEFIVDDNLLLEWKPINKDNIQYMLLRTDIYGNQWFTKKIFH